MISGPRDLLTFRIAMGRKSANHEIATFILWLIVKSLEDIG